MRERGAAIGDEARGKGVHIWLGPTVGPLGRKPLGGRNWEGFGADPVLQAVGARETIRGVQEKGVTATVKHLVGNEQEMYRMYNPFQQAYSANIGVFSFAFAGMGKQQRQRKRDRERIRKADNTLSKMTARFTSCTSGPLPRRCAPESAPS